MIPRNLSKDISQILSKTGEHKNVLIVDGVRQTGKTTAIRQSLEKLGSPFLELNLEKNKSLRQEIDQTIDFKQFEQLLKQKHQFVPSQGRILFIDEANESNQLGAYVRQMKEDWPNQTVVLSGSMMNRLFRNKDIRIPVGRVQSLTVQPFSFLEFLRANENISSSLTQYGLEEIVSDPTRVKKCSLLQHNTLLSLLDHYMTCGGMPEIACEYLTQGGQMALSQAFFQFLTFIKEDFLRIFSEEYANLFDRAIASVANTLGQPYKKSLLIQNNPKLAENILAIFEGWRFLHKIEQKTHNPNVSNSFHPKRYLYDTGIAKFKRETGLASINILATLDSLQREPVGGLIEQMVCCELKALFPDLCGFREKNFEIDFIVKTKTQTIPVECKASLKPNSNQYRGLDLYNTAYRNKIAVIVSLAPYSEVRRGTYKIIHLPLYAIGCLGAMF